MNSQNRKGSDPFILLDKREWIYPENHLANKAENVMLQERFMFSNFVSTIMALYRFKFVKDKKKYGFYLFRFGLK